MLTLNNVSRIEELRERTYNDLVQKLYSKGRCALVRPTGFGKTGILTRLLSGYRKVLFLYPSDVVKAAVLRFYYGDGVSSDATIPNVIFMTYMGLINLSKKEMKNLEVDLIISDECHKLGAKRTSTAMRKLLSVSDAHFVGATATPVRMDLFDVIEEFFHNNVVFEYTLHDAFMDNIYRKPYYCYCTYADTSELKKVEDEAMREVNKIDVGKEEVLSNLRSKLIEISNLLSMENTIRDICDAHIEDTSYMKFIIFFSNFEHMRKKGDDVERWFCKAYPEHTVHSLRVSSETQAYHENVEELEKLKRQEKVIDLIYCVDMLNLGYHVPDLTGIMMYRGTESGLIYIQQLGRALNSGSDIACVVFDVVDNLHRESVYSVLGKKSKQDIEKRGRLEELKIKSEVEVLSDSEVEELKELEDYFTAEGGKWWLSANRLVQQDLVVVGHEAEYRELIAKTVAEPVSIRCRQAWKRWKERGGSDNPFTREHILGQKAPDAVPLSPFCELKYVSVEAVLREMGL